MSVFVKLSVFLCAGKSLILTEDDYENYKNCDGFVICGGGDIDPKLYGQKNRKSRNIEVERDEMEMEILGYAEKNNKPILGICRGAQILNVFCGGNLYQDAKEEKFQDFIVTDSLFAKMFSRKFVKIINSSKLRKIFAPKNIIFVNSLHHQAIRNLGDGLKIVAKDEIGIVQSVENRTKKNFMMGVQWHPEFMFYRKNQRKIFKTLIEESRQAMI